MLDVKERMKKELALLFSGDARNLTLSDALLIHQRLRQPSFERLLVNVIVMTLEMTLDNFKPASSQF